MPRVRFRSHSATNDQTTDQSSGTVPGQRGTQESTGPPQSAEYSQSEGRGSTATGNQGTQADYGQTQGDYGQTQGQRSGTQTYDRPAEGRRAETDRYGEPVEGRRRRPYYGMAGTLMVLSGLLTFFIGIIGIIRGTFFTNVANYPFYYSVRSRGVTFVVLGAVAFVVGIAMVLHMYWARHVAIVVAVLTAVANFMFLPFYPFWSIVVLALNVLIIWELTRDRGESRRREFARLSCLAGRL